MSTGQGTRISAEEFIEWFFDPKSNIAWRDRDPGSSQSQLLAPELVLLETWDAAQSPVVLPFRAEKASPLSGYVLTHGQAEAAVVGDMLTAFVGPTYSSFDGLPARLDPASYADEAVSRFLGNDGVVFKVTFPLNRQISGEGWDALELFKRTVRQRPRRNLEFPKPVGRLLREFEVALAAGEVSASAELLEQLDVTGGFGAANIAYLKIKRLARLGRDTELLGRVPGLHNIVMTRPPVPVRDAILAAIFTTALAEPLEEGNLPTARQALLDPAIWELIPELLNGGTGRLSGEALAVIVVAASVYGNDTLLATVLDDPASRDLALAVAPALSALAPAAPDASPEPEVLSNAGPDIPSAVNERRVTGEEENSPTAQKARSWLEFAQLIAAGHPDANEILESEVWREWDPPVTEDQEVAELLARLGTNEADRAWSLTGPFIDASGYDMPAARTARTLLNIALYNDHYGPGDIAGIISLTGIVVSSGPSDHDFEDLLDDLAAETNRWVSPDRATAALDLADLLARAGRGSSEAELRLASALLSPLHDRTRRLESDQARFAQQLSDELRVGLEWPDDIHGQQDESPVIPPARVLLYSLDEEVLSRTRDILYKTVPGVKVHLNHEKVGSPSMRDQARGADIVVMATRCAKHAATGYIRQHVSSKTLVKEADGSGAASLLRATVAALKERAGI